MSAAVAVRPTTQAQEGTMKQIAVIAGTDTVIDLETERAKRRPGPTAVRVPPAKLAVPIASDTDLAWLAGLIEGEGSADSNGRYPRLRVGMSDSDVVKRAAGLMGCTVRSVISAPGRKPMYHAEISGERAAALIWQLIPHMGARRTGRMMEVLRHYYVTDGGSMPGPMIVPAA